MKILLKNALVVNEHNISKLDVLIKNDLIIEIDPLIHTTADKIIDLQGQYLLPGIIDDQVHFREPGLTHKGTIASESKAAVAGGITSFIEQPNTVPNATTQALLEDKYQIAAKTSYANYSFSMGGTNDNLDELLKTNPKNVAAIKLFLGSSTGNMLVDNPEVLENIFSKIKMPICVHCEDENIIQNNTEKFKTLYGENIPMECHPLIRSEEACYNSSKKAIELAKKTGARLHIYHISTAKETALFENNKPLKDKKITSEVCVHHLSFSDEDYKTKGSLIKWNPAVKTKTDQITLWKALLEDKIDVIATDHAPHTWEEKQNKYLQCPSGGPLVQHSLLLMLENYSNGDISLEKIVEKMCHNPSILFNIEKRGYIQVGYKADLVAIKSCEAWTVEKNNIHYQCGWSPIEGKQFHHQITHTFVNGHLAYNNGQFSEQKAAERLTFDR